MQLIQGTEVELVTPAGTETVENVLIGSPSSGNCCGETVAEFVLGIPKGDTHDWLDRKVRFFGREFRTIGYPEQGIEANIPLAWGMNVHVQYLCSNGDCTIYEKDTFQRHVCEGVHFYDGRGRTVEKDGVRVAGAAEIFIFGVNNSEGYAPKAGDLIVPGVCQVIIDTTSQQSVSEGVKQLRTGGDLIVVKSVVRSSVGRLPDYEITAG